ncbi:amidohydrolase family protein [Joostella atrarenae]|uniref:Amidohydrolase family protein n=1 Tax=Joostella atrarenae TaxID=679257 RepID=A0ABS9J594_9FLAO|nr:amidohydrolase family protein [Joostella atrarenae]MCF8715607.1 amidohydrolase family protein [Joostella atrarenae]
MKIDSHQHFWKYNPVRDSWIDDTMKVIRKDFMPEDLLPVLKENKIDGCVAVQADQSEEETDFLLNLSDKNSFIEGVVGWVDLKSSTVDERLEHYSKFSKFKGVRHIVQAESNNFQLREDFQKGIGALKKYGLTYDILISKNQLSDTIKMVDKFPDQPFVLDHIAKPEISNGIEKEWKDAIRLLAQNENVYCKVSGMVTETKGYKWNKSEFIPFLEEVTQSFGSDRIMFGSDWPVCLVAATYAEVLDVIKSFYTEEDLDKVMSKNAIDFYRL